MIKRYKSDVCRYKYKQKDNLERHVKFAVLAASREEKSFASTHPRL